MHSAKTPSLRALLCVCVYKSLITVIIQNYKGVALLPLPSPQILLMTEDEKSQTTRENVRNTRTESRRRRKIENSGIKIVFHSAAHIIHLDYFFKCVVALTAF